MASGNELTYVVVTMARTKNVWQAERAHALIATMATVYLKPDEDEPLSRREFPRHVIADPLLLEMHFRGVPGLLGFLKRDSCVEWLGYVSTARRC